MIMNNCYNKFDLSIVLGVKMPTYKYVCKKCDYQFEIFQNMKEDSLDYCPKCGGQVVRKIDKGSGIIFKGKGFYQTDYKHSHSVS